MSNTAETIAVREPLPRALLARTGDSLLRIFAAATEAEEVIEQFLSLPQVKAALQREHSEAAPSARPKSCAAEEPTHPRARASRLLSHPAGSWDRVIADWPASRRVGTFRHLIAVAEEHLRTDPERAHAITSFVLRQITAAPPPRHAPTLRELLSGHALLAHARALVALRAYDAAMPIIAAAHAALRGSRAYEIERTHAQLLRACSPPLAATKKHSIRSQSARLPRSSTRTTARWSMRLQRWLSFSARIGRSIWPALHSFSPSTSR